MCTLRPLISNRPLLSRRGGCGFAVEYMYDIYMYDIYMYIPSSNYIQMIDECLAFLASGSEPTVRSLEEVTSA